MKTYRLLLAAACLGFGFGGDFHSTASAATPAGFEIPWWTIDGGGGVSSGGGFEVAGTIGQPDAALRSTDGCWSVDAGFWGAYAVIETPGAPTLRIRLLNPNYIRVSFDPGCDDWVLQYATGLGVTPVPTVWADDTASNLTVDGDDLARDFHLPSWGSRLFFRLRRP